MDAAVHQDVTGMSTMDVGESQVGAYLRHVVAGGMVVYKSFFGDWQRRVNAVLPR
jgi:hypothetical protein